MISIKQPNANETFLFERFLHISLNLSFYFCLFLNTTTLFIELMVQIGLYILVSSKHIRNCCVLVSYSYLLELSLIILTFQFEDIYFVGGFCPCIISDEKHTHFDIHITYFLSYSSTSCFPF